MVMGAGFEKRIAKTVLKSGFETSFKPAIEKQFPKRFREMLPETALENDSWNQR
jgi:hypothetical protein